MNHLELTYSSESYGKRCLSFLIYAVVIVASIVGQAVAYMLIIPIVLGMDSSTIQTSLSDIDKNLALFTLLLPFAISLLLMLLLIRYIHNRNFAQTVNGTKAIRWRRVFFSFGLWIGIMAILTIAAIIMTPEELTLQFEVAKFIPLLIISIALIPLQTTFEEIMLRGYLAQGIALVTRSRWLSFLLPAIIFSLLHMGNPEVAEHGMGIMLASYFAMALIWGITSILDDGLEISMGMHAANNLFISLFTTQKNAAFETYAIFEVDKNNPYIAFVELVAIGALVIFICYRKYNWSFTIFNKKIENPSEATPSIH